MEFSEEYIQYASQIVERLLSGEHEKPYLEFAKDIVISDLEMDANLFLSDLDFAEWAGISIPAVKITGDDGYIPVSFRQIFPPPWGSGEFMDKKFIIPWRNYRYDEEFFYRLLRWYETEEPITWFTKISHSEARDAFTRRAINFLATRITAVISLHKGEAREREKWGRVSTLNLLQTVGGVQVTTPGCHFTVSTNSIGLRVFWSGAYYISPNYFSQPTTPVTSVLQAGTYIFGVDGGAYRNIIQWDTNAVVSLPGNPYVHLNY